MGKTGKADKRKAKLKARKQQSARNDQVRVERLSAALEALCAPILPEYIDDSNGADAVGRQIVYRFGVIA